MATSPIYNWPEPDNTDLVKNGALAIRTLGNAIDTTMGTMVAKTVVDAKGDLIAGTAADTVNRLAVGNNGETLVADSSTSTGLRWQAAVNPNPVLNSAFQIWQRGTSVATGTAFTYGADRWQSYRGALVAGLTVSRQATADTTNLPFIQYCARVQRDSGNTSTNSIVFYQSFESINSIPYAGKTVTVSFYARKGANYSQASSTLNATLNSGTGTDQNFGSAGYTGHAIPGTTSPTLTTTWQRFQMNANVAATATELTIQFDYTPSGTAGAADFFEVTGIMLEVGTPGAGIATPFKTYAATIQGELAACQRYYYRTSQTTNGWPVTQTGYATSTTVLRAATKFPVTMRIAPTALEQNGTAADYRVSGAGGAATTCSAVPSFVFGHPDFAMTAFTVALGLIAYNAGWGGNNSGSSADSYLAWSAEL